MAVLIGGLAARDTVTDADPGTAGLQLQGAYGVHTLTLGTRHFVYVAGREDGGISAFELGADGSLTHIQGIDDGDPTGLATPYELLAATQFASAVIGGTTYLYVDATTDDGISAFRVNADGSLTSIQNITDNATLELNGAEGKMAVATVGTATYLVASGDDDNGLSVFEIGPGGTLTNRFNVTDTLALELDNALDVVTVTVGTSTFVCAAGEDDDGIAVFQLNANGSLTSTFNVTDDATMELDGVAGLATAKVGGVTYLVASGGLDNGLSVFALDAGGKLTNVCNVPDDAARGLGGAQGLTTFKVGTESFVAVSGRTDNALSVFHLGLGGLLTDMTAAFDGAGVTLAGSYYNAFSDLGGLPRLIAAGRLDNGVTSFELGGGADSLTGTAGADILMGLGGSDTLDGGGGTDEAVYLGAQGSYAWGTDPDGVFRVRALAGAPEGGTDELVSIERLRFSDGVVDLVGAGGNQAPFDIDILSGGTVATGAPAGTLVATLGAQDPDPGETFAYALVSDPSGFFAMDGDRIVVRAGTQVGATAGSITVRVRVTDSEGSPYEEDLVIAVQAAAATPIIGTTAADTLTGSDAADDEIWGRAGNDVVSGLGGNDRLFGEGGADRLIGGTGADELNGGLGNDTYVVNDADLIVEASGAGTDTVRTSLASLSLVGHANVEHLTFEGTGGFSGTGNGLNNTLTGGTGSDVLSGAGGNDILRGNAGIDQLDGGEGADTLTGAAGNDRLTGGAGNDTLTGGTGADNFVFAAGFGADRVTDFDHNATGGQDRIDLDAFGITEGTFAARVTLTDLGADILVTIDGNSAQTIRLVNAQAATNITIDDFLL